MARRDSQLVEARLRIDPVLVDKFRRLPGGINEVGTKIIRDLGLRYEYDKERSHLDIIGPDTDILGIAVETLRFWVERDDFPHTGITCQVGYPNRGIVIWRFHGDYAKKFDHLFPDDIARLKLLPTVNIKAVPTKRNPEYVEFYCHFSMYKQVREEVNKISVELGKIVEEDFFIPKSDFQKARKFAQEKSRDDKVLYAIKENPGDKIRVWLFARDQVDIIKAKRQWVTHVGMLARDNEFEERQSQFRDSELNSASFFGHPMSATTLGTASRENLTEAAIQDNNALRFRTHPSKEISPREPKYDNPNFPRPPDFAYPIPNKDPYIAEPVPEHHAGNPFVNSKSIVDELNAQSNITSGVNPLAGESKWVTEDDVKSPRDSQLTRLNQPNRIYVHHQVENPTASVPPDSTTVSGNPFSLRAGKQVVHPEKNLIVKERFNATVSKSVLTSDKKGNKGVRTGAKKKGNVKDSTRRRPVLKAEQPPPSIRYNINVNGLKIFMYKQNIVKLNNMDALVNVVTPDLKHGDLTANLMFEEMGKQVTDEIDVHLSLYGEVQTAANIVTSAGKIPALGIIHVVSPVWQNYTVWEECATDLHKAIYQALKTAEAHKYRRIALPVIGVEPLFGIPKDLVAEVFVKALIDYSMGMGPLYPVLEIHLVDQDPSMLTYIKDAYESWASMPGVADDMTQHITTDSVQTIRLPDNVSDRRDSAVTLKGKPSHLSENMVTFVEQSYTGEGEQKWTFDVLRRLTVHVYTGSVLKLESVDAIVCAVDGNMKGNLVKNLETAGGKPYQIALKKERGTRALNDGDVIVCEAGLLPFKYVVHSVISKPVYTASQRNLTRLDNINTQVLAMANQLKVKVLAMPLIGTGRLRERFEVEQCSLQLVDNIIELCLNLDRKLQIRELHLVNINHVMTQYLTQALRTRAHTKVRMEVESHSLSRSEVLSHAEAIRGATPSQRAKLSEHIASSKEDKSAKKNKVLNQETLVQAEPDKQENKDVSDGSELVVNDSVFAENNPDVSNEQTKQTKEEVDQTPYLSQKMLEVHTKLLKDAWLQLVDEDIEDPDLQKVRRDEKRKLKKEPEFKKHNQLKPIEAEILNRLEMDGLGERPKSAQKPFARRKHIRRRIMQRSSDFIYQKSKAESYGEKFEKKQKYKLSTAKTDGLGRIRKSQSTDDLRSEYISDSLLKGFETERVRLRNERKRRFDESDELTEEERAEHEKYLRETQKYFTRATRDRYKETKHISDIHDEFELLNRVNVRETNTNLQNPQSILRKSKPQMRNTEREDEYMMDMDFLVKEQNKQANRDHSPIDKVDNNQGSLNKSYNKSDRSFNLRRERFLNLTDVSSRSYKKNPDTNANQENNKTKRENNGPLEYIKDKQEAHIDHIDNREMNATQEDHRRSKDLIQEERNLGDANKTTKAQKASVQRAHSERIVQYKYPDASDLYYGKHSHETGRPGETGMMLQNKPASPLGYQYAEYVDPKYQQYSKYLSENPQQYEYQRNPYPAHLSQQNTQTQYSTYQLKKSTNPVQHYQIDAVVQLPSSISNANKYRQDNENHYNDVNQQKEILGNVRDRNKQDKKLEVTVNNENPPAEMNKEANEDRVDESYPQQPDINDNAQSKTTASTPNEMNNVANPKTKSADAEDAINVNADFIEQSLQEEELLYNEKSQEADASAPKSFSPTNLATEDEKDKDGLNHLDETITHPDYVRTDEVSEGDNSSFKEVDIPLNAAVRDVSTPKTFATADDIVKNANAVVSTTNNKKRHMVMVKKKYKTYTMPNIGLDRHERPYVEQPVLLRNRQFKKMPIDRVHPDTIIALDLYSDDNKASDKKVTFEDKLRHPNKINKYALDKIRKPKQNAYGNEFSVRDNIKLEIDIVEKKLPKIDGEKMETEKKKIKRFWEVVGGKDVNNERDIYGENGKPTTNKVLVTKVTKQRVLSAKSKASHKTQATSVKQHNVGKYNVTVEVAN